MRVWGTRAGGNTATPGKKWLFIEFALAIHHGIDEGRRIWRAGQNRTAGEEEAVERATKNLRDWCSDNRYPTEDDRDLEENIFQYLFGDGIALSQWKSQLRSALVEGRETKAENQRKAGGAKAISSVIKKRPVKADRAQNLLDAADATYLKLHKFKADPTNLNELLRTDIRATALVGRAGELEMLQTWLDTQQKISVKCVIGEAGAGKTRLAIEACEAAEAAGWFAAFVQGNNLRALCANNVQSGANWNRPTLIVVDYAAASINILKEWFGILARSHNVEERKLRILLLERHADRKSGWWADLLRPDSNTYASAADLLRGEVAYVLRPLDAAADRRALLGEVMAKAAPLFDPPRPTITPPRLGEDAWFDKRITNDNMDNGPLYLAMAGIRAVECGAPAAISMNKLELASYIARIEERRAERFAVSRGLSNSTKLFNHIIACVTLQNGCDARELLSIIKSERQVMGWPISVDDETLAEILCDFLPSASKVEPVRPDLIGESFCLPIIEGGRIRDEQAQIDIVLRAYQRDSAGTIGTLIRCACDLAEGRTDHYSVNYLESLAKFSNGAAIDIAWLLPEDSLSLSVLSAQIYFHMVKITRDFGRNLEFYEISLAKWMRQLGSSMRMLGKSQQVLETTVELVDICRELSIDKPDVFPPLLAESLELLSEIQTDLGFTEEALRSVMEAVEIYRGNTLGYKFDLTPYLASSLNTLGTCFGLAGKFSAALAPLAESVTYYRSLVIDEPEEFIPTLANALTDYSSGLGNVGQKEAALEFAKESVNLYRRLSAELPDAFESHLAASLTNLASRLHDMDEYAEATIISGQAIVLWRRLADRLPDAFSPGLACSLNNSSNYLAEVGQGDAALSAVEEAVAMNRRLAIDHPSTSPPNLALSLLNLAKRFNDVDRPKAALDAAAESVAIYRPLQVDRPNLFTRQLAGVLEILADCLSDLGEMDKALGAIQEAVALTREWVRELPEVYLFHLVIVLAKCARNLQLMGCHEAALSALEEGTTLCRGLTTAEAGISNLVVSLYKLAEQFHQMGRSQDARAATEEIISIYSQLPVDQAQGHTTILVNSLFFLSVTLEAEGRLEEALLRNRDAIIALSPLFFDDPPRFIESMGLCVTNYTRRAKDAEVELDEALLAPIFACWAKHAPAPE